MHQHQKITVHTIQAPLSEKSVSTATMKKQPAKPAPKKGFPAKRKQSEQKAILKEISNSLATLSSASGATLKKPDLIVPIFLDFSLPSSIDTPIIQEQICLLLQESLQLPEFGEVKIALSIDREGSLQSLTVLSSKSAKNEAFLKNRLPQLQFPCLNEEVSLTIVFSNAL